MTSQVLHGLRTEPLASYLAGLGLARLLGEQADAALTVHWGPGGLVLETAVDDIAGWLLESYVPTPVLSPWNEGSGFGAKDVAPRQRLAELIAHPSPRLDPYREAMPAATAAGERYRADTGKRDEAKARAVRHFRNLCAESLLPWVDASVVLGGDQAYFPPLLGTGGNDGRLDFSTTFHQRLLEVLDPTPKGRERSLRSARDLLTGDETEKLQSAPVGQFAPAAAGGKGSSPFGDAGSLVNPWGFVLLIEGALLFAASVARRQLHGARRAAMPFTVIASPDGSASGAEGESSRGEVWAPVWTRPYTLPEVRQLFTEARATWRGRPAQRAVDFYAATRTLGVARGVEAFQRYGLHQRNGLAFVAVPIERVKVDAKPAVRLAGPLEEWVSWVRRGESTTAVGGAVRRFDTAMVDFTREPEPMSLARLLAALTDLEQAAGRSGRTRDNVPVRRPVSAREFLPELAPEPSPELRVAVGLASCAARPGVARAGARARTLRQVLLPVEPDGRWRTAPLVPGFGARPLTAVLSDVLVWRSRTAAEEEDSTPYRGVPAFRYGVKVPAADLHAFATGALDPRLLDLLLRACLALRWEGIGDPWEADDLPFLPLSTLGLLHPLAAGIPPAGAPPGAPRIAMQPDWAVRLAGGQVPAVHAEAVRRLGQAGWRAVPTPGASPGAGVAIAAALVPRCRRPLAALVNHLATPARTVDQDNRTKEPV